MKKFNAWNNSLTLECTACKALKVLSLLEITMTKLKYIPCPHCGQSIRIKNGNEKTWYSV